MLHISNLSYIYLLFGIFYWAFSNDTCMHIPNCKKNCLISEQFSHIYLTLYRLSGHHAENHGSTFQKWGSRFERHWTAVGPFKIILNKYPESTSQNSVITIFRTYSFRPDWRILTIAAIEEITYQPYVNICFNHPVVLDSSRFPKGSIILLSSLDMRVIL